ncbi:MAG: hypothetical protein JWQ35_1846 [Bacteriovoracaceae bacterium]|nr:hypothetical protein [Bacteriovoracaceae bacterium]
MIKLTKKELKKPDEIWQASRTLMDWMTDQFTAIIIICVLAFIGIIAGIYSYQTHQKTEGRAQYHYSLARTHFEQWKLEASDEKQAKERDATEVDIKKELDLLSSDYKSSYANKLADQIRAELAASKKNWTEATALYLKYEKVLPRSVKDFARYPLAEAYEESKNLPKALETYDQILNQKESVYSALALLGKARVLKLMNKLPEAKQAYESFLEKHPDSPEVANVRGLLAGTLEDIKK